MWLINTALRRPITILVIVVGVALGSALALTRMPVDIFPNLNLPVIYVAQPYGGMEPAQMESFRTAMRIRPGHEWDKFEGLGMAPARLQAFLDQVPFARGERRHQAARIAAPAELPVTIQPVMSTQTGFGALLNELGRGTSAIAERIVTASPDVTVSTNLGPWVNRRGLFAREKLADTFKSERIPSTFNWDFSPKGQHFELGIAEMNLFILLSALGLSHAISGERLIPIGTLYDPFIQRGLDALNYACYQEARFILVATPSGITLAGEGGAHQSIGTPLIGMAQDGLAAFEPAYVDELAAILAWSFDYIQKNGEGQASERNWLRDETGGSVYLRLSTRPVEQIKRTITPELRQGIIDGAYWMRKPGPNCQVVIAYTGAVAPEAIQATGFIAEFAAVAQKWQMDWQLRDARVKPNVLILVSRSDHCLNDLLYRAVSQL